MPIANTVKTRKVRAGFRRGQDVIRRKRDFQRRNADFLHRRAKAFERFGSVHDGFANISGQALAEHFLRQTDAQALHACFHLTVHGRIATFDGGRVAAIVAGNRVQHKRVVRHSLRHRADLIQRRGKRDQPIAADHAIRRLHANNAAERCGLANRAAGVAAERKGGFIRRDARCRAAGRPTRHARQITRVMRGVKRAVFGGRAHGKFIQIRLAEQDAARRLQLFPDRGRVRRYEIRQHFGCAGGFAAFDADVVLHGDGNAAKRRHLFALLPLLVAFVRLTERFFLVQADIRLHLALHLMDAIEIRLRDLAGGQIAALHGLRQFQQRHSGNFHD